MAFDKKDPKQWFMAILAVIGFISLIFWAKIIVTH